MKVSVILTTFQRKDLLKRSVKAVLEQSFEDFELIVVDDHSMDGTQKLMNKLAKKDKRIKYIRLEENHGSDSYPKNKGIQLAEGKFIAFMDDDDVYKVDALKALYNYISLSGADLVYGDYIFHYGKEVKPGWSVDFDMKLLQKMNYIAMPVVCVKRDCLLEVGGFDENVPKFKDWNLWLRLAKRGYSFLHIALPITDVYIQKESVSTKYDVKTDKKGSYLPTYFDPVDCPIYATKTCLGKEKPLRVAVFTMTMNRLYYTKKCFEQLKKTVGFDYDHFVLDQNSEDGTVEWLEKQKDLKVIYSPENIGIAKGWNTMVKEIGQDYDIIIKIDNDAYFLTKDWLKELVEIFRRQRKIILSPYVEGLDAVPGGVLRQSESGTNYALINDRVLGLTSHLGGIVFASPKELYDNWEFKEDMKGNKDFILSQYAKQLGYQLAYFEEARVWHYEGTKGQHKRYPEHFKKLSFEKI